MIQTPPPPGPFGQPPPPGPPDTGQHRLAPKPKRTRRWSWPVIVVGAAVVLALAVIVGYAASPAGGKVTSTVTPTRQTATATPPQTWTIPAVETATLQPARKITAREWQLIAKSPDAHTGERVIVYGQVTQFDAATSTAVFRGSVDGIEHKPKYGYADYDTNTILTGDETALRDVVQGDLFRAEVTVAGSMSYDTAIGGKTTTPKLTVTKLDVIGHID